MARKPEYEGDAHEVRQTEDMHLGDVDLPYAEQAAPPISLATQAARADRPAHARRPPAPWPNGANRQISVTGKSTSLRVARRLDQGQVAARSLQHHRLVNHGEFQMRRRIVYGDAGILGQRDDHQRDEQQARATPRRNGSAMNEVGAAGQAASCRGEESERSRRSAPWRARPAKRSSLAADADAAEGRADIHAVQRQPGASRPQQPDHAHEIGRPAEHQPRGEARNQGGRHPGQRRRSVGRAAEQPGRAFGDHRFLRSSLARSR